RSRTGGQERGRRRRTTTMSADVQRHTRVCSSSRLRSSACQTPRRPVTRSAEVPTPSSAVLAACVSYIEYVNDDTGANASTTKPQALVGYVKDAPGKTRDKCRSGRRVELQGSLGDL